MKMMITVVAAVLLAGGSASRADESTLLGAMKGSLVAVQGKGIHNFDVARLAGTKYFGFYYSASWCPPCQLFTPKLVEFYNRIKPQHPEFEIVFISSDESLPAMEAYMKTDKMPWPALMFGRKEMKKRLNSYSGPGIPCLVFVDASGKVLSDSYEGTNYVGPNKVVQDIEKTLSGEPASPRAPAAAPGASPARGGGGGSSFDDFFKKK